MTCAQRVLWNYNRSEINDPELSAAIDSLDVEKAKARARTLVDQVPAGADAAGAELLLKQLELASFGDISTGSVVGGYRRR